MDFIQQLRDERRKQGLRQVDVAEMVGMTPKYYQRIEARRTSPRYDTLSRIADALGCAVTLAAKEGKREV